MRIVKLIGVVVNYVSLHIKIFIETMTERKLWSRHKWDDEGKFRL